MFENGKHHNSCGTYSVELKWLVLQRTVLLHYMITCCVYFVYFAPVWKIQVTVLQESQLSCCILCQLIPNICGIPDFTRATFLCWDLSGSV